MSAPVRLTEQQVTTQRDAARGWFAPPTPAEKAATSWLLRLVGVFLVMAFVVSLIANGGFGPFFLPGWVIFFVVMSVGGMGALYIPVFAQAYLDEQETH